MFLIVGSDEQYELRLEEFIENQTTFPPIYLRQLIKVRANFFSDMPSVREFIVIRMCKAPFITPVAERPDKQAKGGLLMSIPFDKRMRVGDLLYKVPLNNQMVITKLECVPMKGESPQIPKRTINVMTDELYELFRDLKCVDEYAYTVFQLSHFRHYEQPLDSPPAIQHKMHTKPWPTPDLSVAQRTFLKRIGIVIPKDREDYDVVLNRLYQQAILERFLFAEDLPSLGDFLESVEEIDKNERQRIVKVRHLQFILGQYKAICVRNNITLPASTRSVDDVFRFLNGQVQGKEISSRIKREFDIQMSLFKIHLGNLCPHFVEMKRAKGNWEAFRERFAGPTDNHLVICKECSMPIFCEHMVTFYEDGDLRPFGALAINGVKTLCKYCNEVLDNPLDFVETRTEFPNEAIRNLLFGEIKEARSELILDSIQDSRLFQRRFTWMMTGLLYDRLVAEDKILQKIKSMAEEVRMERLRFIAYCYVLVTYRLLKFRIRMPKPEEKDRSLIMQFSRLIMSRRRTNYDLEQVQAIVSEASGYVSRRLVDTPIVMLNDAQVILEKYWLLRVSRFGTSLTDGIAIPGWDDEVFRSVFHTNSAEIKAGRPLLSWLFSDEFIDTLIPCWKRLALITRALTLNETVDPKLTEESRAEYLALPKRPYRPIYWTPKMNYQKMFAGPVDLSAFIDKDGRPRFGTIHIAFRNSNGLLEEKKVERISQIEPLGLNWEKIWTDMVAIGKGFHVSHYNKASEGALLALIRDQNFTDFVLKYEQFCPEQVEAMHDPPLDIQSKNKCKFCGATYNTIRTSQYFEKYLDRFLSIKHEISRILLSDEEKITPLPAIVTIADAPGTNPQHLADALKINVNLIKQIGNLSNLQIKETEAGTIKAPEYAFTLSRYQTVRNLVLELARIMNYFEVRHITTLTMRRGQVDTYMKKHQPKYPPELTRYVIGTVWKLHPTTATTNIKECILWLIDQFVKIGIELLKKDPGFGQVVLEYIFYLDSLNARPKPEDIVFLNMVDDTENDAEVLLNKRREVEEDPFFQDFDFEGDPEDQTAPRD